MDEKMLRQQVHQINTFFLKRKMIDPIYGDPLKDKYNYIAHGSLLIAFISYNIMKRYNRINIKKLMVREEYRHQGYGHELLKRIKIKCLDIQLYVSNTNEESIKWYKSNYFKVINKTENTTFMLYKSFL